MNKAVFFLFIISVVFAYQKRNDVRDFFYTPPDYAAKHGVDVVMYGASWCSYCAKMRAVLKKNGIPYYEYDVEKSREGYKQFSELGGEGVPLIQVGGTVVRGYNPGRVLELVDAIN